MLQRRNVALKEVPASDWLDAALKAAVEERASDIHLEPFKSGEIGVRFRIDGMLADVDLSPVPPSETLMARIKILANLNTTEARNPQDGHFEIPGAEHQALDVRVSFVPTIYGEAAVLRLLNRQGLLMEFPELGFTSEQLGLIEELVRRPNGMIFTTGPSGSGKTTVLYALLRRLNEKTRSILTLEDPVEYQLEGIRQTQVSSGSGLTFAAGLRSFLRQDPDIIMVGEIRDEETAEIASRAALTGHLVLSTLHANSGVGVIVRLTEMGVGRATLASSLAAVISRRLIRTICDSCKEQYDAPAVLKERLSVKAEAGQNFWRGRGCRECNQSGYRGRTGIHEILNFDGALKSLILEEHSYNALVEKIHRDHGVKTLREDGLDKVYQGLTTLDEILRVTEDDDAAPSSHHRS